MAYRKYAAVSNATNTQSATNPMYSLVGSTTVRVRLYDWISGSDAAPADNATKLAFQRQTTRGTTSSSAAATALDPADPATGGFYDTGWTTTFPTLTANAFVLQVPQNQRATFRWVAAPDGEIVIPATAANGLALMAEVTSSAVNFAWTNHWIE